MSITNDDYSGPSDSIQKNLFLWGRSALCDRSGIDTAITIDWTTTGSGNLNDLDDDDLEPFFTDRDIVVTFKKAASSGQDFIKYTDLAALRAALLAKINTVGKSVTIKSDTDNVVTPQFDGTQYGNYTGGGIFVGTVPSTDLFVGHKLKYVSGKYYIEVADGASVRLAGTDLRLTDQNTGVIKGFGLDVKGNIIWTGLSPIR
jgi:hypothetical protein